MTEKIQPCTSSTAEIGNTQIKSRLTTILVSDDQGSQRAPNPHLYSTKHTSHKLTEHMNRREMSTRKSIFTT